MSFRLTFSCCRCHYQYVFYLLAMCRRSSLYLFCSQRARLTCRRSQLRTAALLSQSSPARAAEHSPSIWSADHAQQPSSIAHTLTSAPQKRTRSRAASRRRSQRQQRRSVVKLCNVPTHSCAIHRLPCVCVCVVACMCRASQLCRTRTCSSLSSPVPSHRRWPPLDSVAMLRCVSTVCPLLSTVRPNARECSLRVILIGRSTVALHAVCVCGFELRARASSKPASTQAASNCWRATVGRGPLPLSALAAVQTAAEQKRRRQCTHHYAPHARRTRPLTCIICTWRICVFDGCVFMQ